jgi:hypothetical protein
MHSNPSHAGPTAGPVVPHALDRRSTTRPSTVSVDAGQVRAPCSRLSRRAVQLDVAELGPTLDENRFGCRAFGEWGPPGSPETNDSVEIVIGRGSVRSGFGRGLSPSVVVARGACSVAAGDRAPFAAGVSLYEVEDAAGGLAGAEFVGIGTAEQVYGFGGDAG